jgi:hypothetical protein
MGAVTNSFLSRFFLLIVLSAISLHSPGSISTASQAEGITEGLISTWLNPDREVNDHARHEIWSTGEVNGCRLILEKSAKSMLRAVLTTPLGTTVARADISGWEQGQWHFVAVSWKQNNTGGNSGSLVLWIDRVAVDGPVVPFPFTVSPVTRSFGKDYPPLTGEPVERTKEAAASVDKVRGAICMVDRTQLTGDEAKRGMVATVYREYFRTAPYEAIEIDVESTRVPSDTRAVAGFAKQFGLKAKLNGRWEPVTENVVRYNQWAYFDAKPFISWSTSDHGAATIDSTGRLQALKPGTCIVTAEFHGLKSNYHLSVTDPVKPDAGVICISLTPRYAVDAFKDRPAAGDTITAHLRFGNFGTSAFPAGLKVRFQLIKEENRNYRPDTDEKPYESRSLFTDRELMPGEETGISIKFIYPDTPAWMKLELDPENLVEEFCEANNSISELTDARPIQLGYRRKDIDNCLNNKIINHIGSLSWYDWLRSEKLRMDVMLREAVWPTTGSNGVEEAYRLDTYTELAGGNWDDEPWHREAIWYDGGFPVSEPVDLMAIDCAIIHEFGHTILSQPDLYGYPVKVSNVFITGDDGLPVAGTPVLPVVSGSELLPASGGINVAGYDGYPSLMDGCQLWLHPSQAGHINFYKGYRADRFWGTQGRLIPSRSNRLILKDINDEPLTGAAVYVYAVSQAPVEDSGEKYFSDRPKFRGLTDEYGRFIFPNSTDSLWDDPETDEADGSVEVWNPFGTKTKETAFTPNVWTVEGLLLIRIVAGSRSEYHFMDLTQFNTEFLSGHTVSGSYQINTCLAGSGKPTALIRQEIPAAIRKINKRPVAIVPPVFNVRAGEEFVIDGSGSYDPEGQPLIYRWNTAEGWLRGNISQSSKMKITAPSKPGTVEYKFWVLDGIRCSEPVRIKVNVL